MYWVAFLSILLFLLQAGAWGQEAAGEVRQSTGGGSLLLQALERGERDPTVKVRQPPSEESEDSEADGGRRRAVRDGEKQYVRVKRVVDGATLELTDGRRVHLIGLDVPEAGRDPRTGFSAEASRVFTDSMVRDSSIGLTFDRERIDEQGRVLVYAWLGGDISLNALIIREGHARADTEADYRRDYKEVFRNAEEEAKANRRGLWGR
jgi:micrococcal nuclease